MEQPGEAPEPEQPAAVPPSSPVPGSPVADDGGPDGQDGRVLLLIGFLAIVALLAVVAWIARGGDDGLDAVEREQERFPSPTDDVSATSTSTSVTPTPAPTVALTAAPTAGPPPPASAPTTTAPTTTAPTTAPPPTPSTTAAAGVPAPVPGASTTTPEEPAHVAALVPSLAAFPEHPTTPEATQAVIDAMLASRRHDIASPDRSAAICAAVPMDRPLAVRGRWERDGRRIAVTDLERRDAPGFGECLDDDGDVLEPGAYQYVAIDGDGRESAAGGIVLGAARLEQPFVNDGEDTLCAIRIAPTTTRYFEIYLFHAAPIGPGTTVELPVAAVEQDVQTVACDGGAAGGDVVSSFSFAPDPATVQSLAP